MRVNEIFCSLQGEGFWTGTAAVFVRFAGCNLRCPFCDTHHQSGQEMSIAEIAERVKAYPARHVVLTGGEPALQISEALISALHAAGKYVAIETNGTHPLPANADWVTLSPKDAFTAGAKPVLTSCDELKLIFDGSPILPYTDICATHRFLQPCDTGNDTRNRAITAAAVAFIKENPTWRLSLQTHKIIQIP